MLLDLSRFRGNLEHLEQRYDPASVARDGDDFRIISPVELVVDVRKDARKVRLVGRVRTTLEVECSRCLEPFTIPVDARVDTLFLPASANTGEGENEVTDEDLGVAYYRDDVIDLGEVMREQFYLALPMKPLCREDCLGLCPVCGTNRNHEACSCKPTWEDPRLEPLKKFMK